MTPKIATGTSFGKTRIDLKHQAIESRNESDRALFQEESSHLAMSKTSVDNTKMDSKMPAENAIASTL